MVTREDFHYNFLKNVIIRLDFQGVVCSMKISFM